MQNTKYPRTRYLPWSPKSSIKSDDKVMTDEDVNNFIGKLIAITRKYDGENNAMTNKDVFARSHANPTRHEWNRNLWDPVNGLHRLVKDYIGDDEIIYGENMMGIHSIEYTKLKSYYYLFAVRNSERWYSWDEVKEFSEILNIPHVPELFKGTINLVNDLKKLIDYSMKMPSEIGGENEGVVIRIADSFPLNDFKYNVCKWVRPNHVQTKEHWTRNWKRAKLN